MIKTILLFTLLFAPAVSSNPSICNEILDVLQEEGSEDINEQEAKHIYNRCIASLNKTLAP